MPNLAEVTARVAVVGRPFLFLDTCVLLDIIRATLRDRSNEIASAVELRARISETSPRCLLVVSSLVQGEWHTHADVVAGEVDRHLEKMSVHSEGFHEACHALNLRTGFGRADYRASGLTGALVGLSRELLDVSIRLDPDEESELRAVKRVRGARPPSRKDGQIQDCIIIEECLTACGSLRADGFTGRLVFCTSNTKDYCDASKRLHDTLAEEFTSVGLAFATNLTWAINELDRKDSP